MSCEIDLMSWASPSRGCLCAHTETRVSRLVVDFMAKQERTPDCLLMVSLLSVVATATENRSEFEQQLKHHLGYLDATARAHFKEQRSN